MMVGPKQNELSLARLLMKTHLATRTLHVRFIEIETLVEYAT